MNTNESFMSEVKQMAVQCDNYLYHKRVRTVPNVKPRNNWYKCITLPSSTMGLTNFKPFRREQTKHQINKYRN